MGLRPSWTEHTQIPGQGLLQSSDSAGGSGSACEPTVLKGKEEKTL